MAAAEQKKPISHAKYFIGFFIILAILGSVWFMFSRFSPAIPTIRKELPADTFTSQVERRSYVDKNGKEIVYYVVASYNNSPENYYQCKFSLTSKGTREKYLGFFQSYTERDCRKSGTQVYVNYDCRISNGINKFLRYQKSQTLARFPSASSSEIAVSKFYIYQTNSADQFYRSHTKEEIFDYTITCNDTAGTPVTHTQNF